MVKVTALLMLAVAVLLSGFVIARSGKEPATGLVLSPTEPTTFAELESAMFPDGPHWVVRGFQQLDLITLTILLVLVVFSMLSTARALRALITGQGLSGMPFISASSLVPIWIGACLTFAMLRFLPYYTGQSSYHHNWIGAIRVTLFTCLIAGLTPAAIAAAAQWRHRSRLSK